MERAYYDCIHLIERLHRHFLEVLKVELDRLGVQDINNVQSLILYNIGEDELTVGELTQRGYYQGSNVSYNVKKMAEHGYIVQERSMHDRRSVRVRLTDKGRELRERIRIMFDRHITTLEKSGLAGEEFIKLNGMLLRLERSWSAQIDYQALASLQTIA